MGLCVPIVSAASSASTICAKSAFVASVINFRNSPCATLWFLVMLSQAVRSSFVKFDNLGFGIATDSADLLWRE